MSRTLSVPIGTTTFHILKFDASTQLKLLGDLQKEILPAAGSLFGAVVGGQTGDGSAGAGEAIQRDEQAVMQALRHLSSRLGGDELQKWFGLLVGPDNVSFELEGREPQKLTEAHRGLAFQDFSEILELMYHVLMHNFAGPLARWASRFGLARGKLGNLSASSAPTLSES
ncbi:phage tail assembly chaperone [Achromobacter xylosoxidans]|uniref:phage tail assembly chaperone n=1 Tax=Alcaligenes xylosoxydans xylosoxydans TaxID=85698 RepID=UPI001EEB1E95|nr:hypothetical protein [Achromobacter xylosoxidans]